MSRDRMAGAALQALLLLVLVLALASCSRASAPTPRSMRWSASTLLAPAPVSSTLARSDPAVWAAVRFERVHCAWDWHQTRRAYLAAQQQLATPAYAAQLAAASDPAAWQHGVVAQKQTVTCTVSAAHRVVGAPATSSTVYARMTVNTEITSTLGSFVGGQRIASWLVQRVAGRWLVAGSFEGG